MFCRPLFEYVPFTKERRHHRHHRGLSTPLLVLSDELLLSSAISFVLRLEESEAKMEPDVHRDEDEAAAPASLPGKGRGRARRLATPEAVASPTEQLRQQQTPVQPATPPPSCSAGRGRGRPSPLKTQRVTQPPGSPQSGVVQRQPTPEATAAAAAITVTDRAPESTLNAETKADGQNCWKEVSSRSFALGGWKGQREWSVNTDEVGLARSLAFYARWLKKLITKVR